LVITFLPFSASAPLVLSPGPSVPLSSLSANFLMVPSRILVSPHSLFLSLSLFFFPFAYPMFLFQSFIFSVLPVTVLTSSCPASSVVAFSPSFTRFLLVFCASFSEFGLFSHGFSLFLCLPSDPLPVALVYVRGGLLFFLCFMHSPLPFPPPGGVRGSTPLVLLSAWTSTLSMEADCYGSSSRFFFFFAPAPFLGEYPFLLCHPPSFLFWDSLRGPCFSLSFFFLYSDCDVADPLSCGSPCDKGGMACPGSCFLSRVFSPSLFFSPFVAY